VQINDDDDDDDDDIFDLSVSRCVCTYAGARVYMCVPDEFSDRLAVDF